ncbi:MAG: peptide deformylase [Rikenellaceae bacterium]|nr:peptide deformylase [Rikenellaceae bacterium]
MIYPIYIYGSSVLRKVAENVAPDYPGLKELVADMFETMYESDGVGLAAPQIGKSLRMFVIDADPFSKDYPEGKGFKRVCINPEIVGHSEETWIFNEGCLSVPGVHEDVERPAEVKVRYLDENFVEHVEDLDGIKARVFQHEFDHLDGNVFTDRLAPIRKTLIKGRLQKMSKGNYKAAYRCKQVK